MTRGRQSVKKGIWYLEEKKQKIRIKRDQRRGVMAIGLIASAAALFLGKTAKPIFKTIFVEGEGKDDKTKHFL